MKEGEAIILNERKKGKMDQMGVGSVSLFFRIEGGEQGDIGVAVKNLWPARSVGSRGHTCRGREQRLSAQMGRVKEIGKHKCLRMGLVQGKILGKSGEQ